VPRKELIKSVDVPPRGGRPNDPHAARSARALRLRSAAQAFTSS
jgi:hypothetical protein